jgi:hypothetical protein
LNRAPKHAAYRCEDEALALLQQSGGRDRERIGPPMQHSVSAPAALEPSSATEASRDLVIEVREIQRAKARKLLVEHGYVVAGRRGKR